MDDTEEGFELTNNTIFTNQAQQTNRINQNCIKLRSNPEYLRFPLPNQYGDCGGDEGKAATNKKPNLCCLILSPKNQ